MFVLAGVLGWVTSLGAMPRGIPPDRSDLIGISPRINLHSYEEQTSEKYLNKYYINICIIEEK